MKLHFALLLAGVLGACTQTPSTPTPPSAVSAAGTPPPAALGYAYDVKLAAGAAWLAYLDSGHADPAVVARVDPLYRAAAAALKTWSDSMFAGTASAAEPAAVTAAYASLAAALQAAGIPVTLPSPRGS